MNSFKRNIFKQKVEDDPKNRIDQTLFSSFAHDNIDADLNRNAVADGIRQKSFHGTISVAQQMAGVKPIQTPERYKPLSLNIKKASDMIHGTKNHVDAGVELVLGIVSAFGENLLSPTTQNAATLSRLLRHALKGH